MDQFLFQTRRGFCELYASSFTVLMRAAGVPARIVTGYLGGEWNPRGEYLRVLQADAHAWAEVWLSGRGWTRMDPTGAVSPTRVEVGASSAEDASNLPLLVRSRYSRSLLNLANLLWDNVDYQWIKWVLAFNADRQKQLFSLFGIDNPHWTLIASIMGLSITAISLATFAWYLYPGRGRRRDPLLKLYTRLCTRLARTGVRLRIGETARDYAMRSTAGMSGEMRGRTLEVVELYNRLRYGKSQPKAELAMLKKKMSDLRISTQKSTQ